MFLSDYPHNWHAFLPIYVSSILSYISGSDLIDEDIRTPPGYELDMYRPAARDGPIGGVDERMHGHRH
jgi:hypothetical protein